MKVRVLNPHKWKVRHSGANGDGLRQLIKEREEYKQLAEIYIDKYFELKNQIKPNRY